MTSNKATSATTNREIFSGPDGQGMCQRKVIDPRYIGDTSREINNQSTKDVSYLFHDAPTNPPPQCQGSYVGAIGWGVKEYSDVRMLKSGTQIRKDGFRGEVIRKAESHPKPI